eukprot:TRINITY_DN16756_c0_g1_i1.p1 TRINITY_DN16756_c0_g1~~TRINITY_DN16756_c0_g1_i1.p1  ORF type:complete len:599 (+),score=133.47 TRINITY_DN16756_c0_g1_i1:99-1895(+)
MVSFDFCVVTASTPEMADLYRQLVRRRQDAGLYPRQLQFRFYSDPPRGRVGSGGGTLLALHELLKEETGKSAFGDRVEGGGCLFDEAAVSAFFGEKKVLVLHAGGESRRLPCYVPEGKLFGPLSIACGTPSDSSATESCPPVVLDLVLSLYARYPWRPGEVIMASGDVIVNFDVASLRLPDRPFSRGNICGFGKAASLAQGSKHGVFAFAATESGMNASATLAVSDFHQKSSVEVLRRECLVPGSTDQCALDMGIFTMDVKWCLAFFRLASEACQGDLSFIEAVEQSQLYFDFYLEVVIASLPGLLKDDYFRRVSSASKLPRPMLELIFDHLGGDRLELRGALAEDAVFLHFGTLREFPQASSEADERSMRPFYSEEDGTIGASCSAKSPGGLVFTNCSPESVQVARTVGDEGASGVISTTEEAAWVEMCTRTALTLSARGFHMLIGLRDVKLPSERPLPAGICLDGRHIDALAQGRQIVAVYSVDDTFKKVSSFDQVIFCGVPMQQWLSNRGLEVSDVWKEPDDSTDLWNARLFCAFDAGAAESLCGYWDVACFARDVFLPAERFSLGELNRLDSALARDGARAGYLAEMRARRCPA